MSADLFEETRMSDLKRATQAYEDSKQNYQRLVRAALAETDPAARETALAAIAAENARLTQIVAGLAQAWSEGSVQEDNLAKQKVLDYQQELEEYKTQMESMHNKQDIIIKLKSILGSLTNENDLSKKSYYAYIIGVLALLIIVFVFFVYSYASSVMSAASSAVSAATEAVSTATTATAEAVTI